jgi:hypothetical protein
MGVDTPIFILYLCVMKPTLTDVDFNELLVMNRIVTRLVEQDLVHCKVSKLESGVRTKLESVLFLLDEINQYCIDQNNEK